MSEVEIDEKTRAALGRLTAAEKECLRRRLRHQTAKEMALELGVSPHAVEKRLKMARAKLGLSSSLDVARLLAVSEGYQRTAPRAPDLSMQALNGPDTPHRKQVMGVLTVILAATAAFTLFVQSSGGTVEGGVARMPASEESAQAIDKSVYEEIAENPGANRSIQQLEFVKASPERVRAYVRQMFDDWDLDQSGFIELAEAPSRLAIAKPRKSGEPVKPYDPDDMAEELEGDAARKQYIANVDKDGDNRVNFEEFAKPVTPQFLERGIPLIPADWTRSAAKRD